MYSLDFKRKTVFSYINKVHSFRKLADLLNIGKSTIQRWVKHNKFVQRKMFRKKINNEVKTYILNYVKKNPFTTAKQIAQNIEQTFNKKLSTVSISCTLKKNNITKKKPTQYICREDLCDKRRQFHNTLQSIDPNSVIAIDESHFEICMKPRTGYCQKGTRLHYPEHPKTVYHSLKYSLLMGVTTNGIADYLLSETNITSVIYNAFLTNLQTPEHIKYALMDNASIHKSADQVLKHKKIIRLYMPPYSPDYNPIEQVFSVVKQAFRKLYAISDISERFQKSFVEATREKIKNMFIKSWSKLY